MACQAHHIDAARLYVDRNLANRLRCVCMKYDVMRSANRGYLVDWLQDADFIVCRHDRHKEGVGRYRCREHCGVNEATRSDGQNLGAETVVRQIADGLQDAIMLGGAGDDVVAATVRRSSDALKRKVVRFGRPGREDDLLRSCTDQCRDC
jgi:hypothetical protein